MLASSRSSVITGVLLACFGLGLSDAACDSLAAAITAIAPFKSPVSRVFAAYPTMVNSSANCKKASRTGIICTAICPKAFCRVICRVLMASLISERDAI